MGAAAALPGGRDGLAIAGVGTRRICVVGKGAPLRAAGVGWRGAAS